MTDYYVSKLNILKPPYFKQVLIAGPMAEDNARIYADLKYKNDREGSIYSVLMMEDNK